MLFASEGNDLRVSSPSVWTRLWTFLKFADQHIHVVKCKVAYVRMINTVMHACWSFAVLHLCCAYVYTAVKEGGSAHCAHSFTL